MGNKQDQLKFSREPEKIFKTSSQAYLYSYLLFREDYAKNIAYNFSKAENSGKWDSGITGKRALLEENHIGEDLNEMARRKLLIKRERQSPPRLGRPRNDRDDDGYKRVLYSINPKWVIYYRDVMHPEIEDLHRGILSSLYIIQACAKNEQTIVSHLNEWYKPTSFDVFSLFFKCVKEILKSIPSYASSYNSHPFSGYSITLSLTISDQEAIQELDQQYDMLIKNLGGPLKQEIIERELRFFNDAKGEFMDPDRFYDTGLLDTSKINDSFKKIQEKKVEFDTCCNVQDFSSYIYSQHTSFDRNYSLMKPEDDDGYWLLD